MQGSILRIGTLRGLADNNRYAKCSYNEYLDTVKQLLKAKKTVEILSSRERSVHSKTFAQSISNIFSNASLPNRTSSILANFILQLVDVFVICDMLTSNCTCGYMSLALILSLPRRLLVGAPTL